MRLIKSLIALCFVAMGVIFGALNRQPVHVDLWFRSFDGRLGLVLLTVLLLGALLGGLAVTAGVVWPMRRRLGRDQRTQSGPDANELSNDRGDFR
jgi:lipopolysaccharide assembly protein A